MRSTTIRAAAAGAALVLSGAAVVLSAATPSGADGHPVAHATVRNAGGAELGKVTFIGRGNHATRARVELTLPAGAPGLGSYHGLHIHANGECVGTSGFTTAGGHWTDGDHPLHGSHLGDLPSVLVTGDGRVTAEFATDRFDVDEIAGRTVILHEGRDNFGNVPVGGNTDQYTANSGDAVTATNGTGNAGPRYGCGVITAGNGR